MKQGNRAPVFTSAIPEVAHPQVGKLFQYQASALDLDGDTVRYEIVPNSAIPEITPTGVEIDPQTGLISWTPFADQQGVHCSGFMRMMWNRGRF